MLLAFAVGPASADPGVRDKQAQAQAILAELDSLDQGLAVAIEAYNYANVELDRIDVDLDKNARHLVAARKSLKVSQKRIAKRLRDLYVKGDGDSTLEVLLGSRSLDDIIARVEAIQRVSSQDARILNEVKRYKAEVEAHRKSLRESRADQVRIVDERASQKASIEGQLAERQALYESVKQEIVQLQEAERRRQAALAAQARARAQAAELAAQAAASAPQTSVATTTYDPGIIPVAPPPDGTRASQVVSIALQYLGVPYVWGGIEPVRVRLFGPHLVRLRADRDLAAASRGVSVQLRRPGRLRRPPARRPRLLQRPRAHGHVHRRRPVHPRAAYRRRRPDRVHVRALGRLRRRPPHPLTGYE